ncbi:hypothetical protein P9D51_12150 [Bacillus sonorensis]|uniref:hypothetical protein n=1 Tax=Bacillus sonorensis TaxID=119858 RepID=UPI000AABE93C|nr:hypothetical protein [Bacillus sonorensis]MCF7617709.1 hypothetical protein [Bacillus sonorensis]MCY8034864.1 hypothetical protein [Bacillus sonorensis]MCY8088059.1 hypothetical protein [Bacillus sonorensis]MCZ0067377.1 hypothetical protein [Bacillus sonorensis]MCZ0095907.1 hypothetical protein [Bacillus sonorensis]
MKNKRLFILALIWLSVIAIGVQEMYATPFTTGLMIVVLITTISSILKEALGGKSNG